MVAGSGISIQLIHTSAASLAVSSATSVSPNIWKQWSKRERCPSVAPRNYQPSGAYWGQIANKVRELCHKHGINDRMPRWIPQGHLATNKRIAEKLFLKVYDLELEGGNNYKT